LPGPFWGAAALFGFTAALVLTNGIGMLQTLGSRLPVRLPAVEDPHRDIITGLIPLILAFGLPVYPLLRLAWLNWLDLGLIWVGFTLMGTLMALGRAVQF
jgi:hypothetical protein